MKNQKILLLLATLTLGLIPQPNIVLATTNQTIEQKAEKLYQQNKFTEAINLLKQAIQNYQRQGDIKSNAIALRNIALVYQKIGDWEQAQQALSQTPALIEESEVLPVIKERLQAGETQWDLLKRMIDGSLTERFIEVISAMPDRDFARNYLKLLEHFKPKVTRTEGAEIEKDDKDINIQMVFLNKNGETQVLDVNKIEDGEEGDIQE